MFYAVFNDTASTLRKVVEIIKKDIPETVLIVKKTGIFIQAMDTGHIALVDFSMTEDVADDFYCTDETHHLGIKLDLLSKIFSSKGAKGICRIAYEDDKPDVLQIVFTSSKKKSSHQLKLYDIQTEQVGIPEDLHYTCSIALNATELQDILKDIEISSQDVVITRRGRKVIFSSVGDGVNTNIDLDIDEDFPGQLAAMFSVKYLSWFAKGNTLNDQVMICLHEEYPMLMQFEEENEFSLKFFVAAKVNENEKQEQNKVNHDKADEEMEAEKMDY